MQTQTSPYAKLTAVMEHYSQNRTQGKVVDYLDYSSLKNELNAIDIKEGSQSWEMLWSLVDTYLTHSVKTAHPQYFNQLWAGQSTPALIGSVIESLANTSMYTYEVAPIATLIETEVLNRFKTVFGFDNGEAQVTTGGSNSNYVALLLALNLKFPSLKQSGLQGLPKKMSIFVSEEAHYSMDKAMVMAGLGLNSLIKVPVDDTGCMQISELKKRLQNSVDEGCVPVSIVGTAGTTVRGAFDNFEQITELAKKFDCWFHVDGAWGGAVAFSESQRHLLHGTSGADSLSWDGHKMLGVPLMCGMLFVRSEGSFDQVCNLGNTSYIFRDGAERQDLGPYSLQCGRRVDMLKMWLEYVFYGEKGFEQRIDKFMQLASLAEGRIACEPSLELQCHRWINNICFRSIPDKGIDIGAFNKRIREELYQSGNSLVNIAYLGQDLTVRLIITNKDVTEPDIEQFFDNWLETAAVVHQEIQQCA